MIRDLLRVCQKYQVEAMSKSTALAALLRHRPKLEDGSILNADRLKIEVEEATAQANQITDEEYVQLETALLDVSEFRPALLKLLNKLK